MSAADPIGPRAMAAAALALIALVVAVVLAQEAHERTRALSMLRTRLTTQVALRRSVLEHGIRRLVSDVQFLASVPPVAGIVRAAANHGYDAPEKTPQALWTRRLETIFAAFARANPDLTQVRLIGVADNGRELVRVDRNQGGVVVVPPDELRPKAHLDYFQTTAKLKRGVHVSDIRLQRDDGAVAEPHVPVLRVASPVFTASGELFGMVVLNLDARALFAEVQDELPDGFQVYLLNGSGDYLIHPDATRSFGFDVGAPRRWQDDFSALAQDEGDATGMYAFQTAAGVEHVASERLPLDPGAPERTLTLHLAASDALIQDSVRAARSAVLLGLSGALVVLVTLSAFYVFNLRQRRQLLVEQARLAAIVECSNDAIIGTSLEGVVTDWNHAAERMFGYLAREAIGRSVRRLIVPAEYHDEDAEILVRVPRGDFLAPFSTRRCRRDGTRFDVVVTVSPIKDARGLIIGAAKTVRDVSQQRASEAVLRETQQRLLITAKTNGIGLWAWDIRTDELQCDETMFELYGRPRDTYSATYDAWRKALHPDDVVATEAAVRRAVEERRPYDTTYRILTAAGELRYIRAKGTVFYTDSGQPVRMLGTNFDCTEEKLREREIHELNLTLEQQVNARTAELESLNSALQVRTKEAEAASLARGQFLANMSHEIRSPMNAILGMLQLLLGTDLSVRQRDYAAKAHWATRSLLHLLNDILDFSKIEAGKLGIEAQPFEIDALLRGVSVILSASTGLKPVEVLFSVDQNLPLELCGDAFRLRQILLNLAGNAIKFTERGAVVVSLRVSAQDPAWTEVEFAVRDTGIGIAADKLAVIFEGFSQAEASTTRRYGGTGLGLAISARLVELMGGVLQVESELGVGSRFHFALRLANVQGDPAREPRTLRGAWTRARRALVVDDHDSAREVLVQVVQSLGLPVESVSSGEDALAKLSSLQGDARYDLVLVDWRMPGMDGLQTAREIRALHAGGPSPAIIMVTAHGTEALAEQQKDEPGLIDGFVSKPVTQSMLLDAIMEAMPAERALERREPRRAGPSPLAGLRLLVVEDNLVNQQVARELLRSQGAEVALAGSGLAGVAQATAAAPPFDAVLMDIQMPDVDGYEATRRIRAQQPSLPIIAMTANALDSDKEACREVGMNDHIPKPIDVDQMVATILTHCGARRPDAAALELELPPEPAVGSGQIEFALALKRMGGNRALYGLVARRFERESGPMAADVRRHLDEGARERATLKLHTLKGLAGTVGMRTVAELAATLEQRLKEAGPSVDAEVELEALERLVGGGNAELAELLSDASLAAPPPAASEPALDGEAADTLLEELEGMLEKSNMRAVTVFQDLEHRFGGALGEQLAALATAMQRLDFKRARDACRKLREQLT